MSRTPSSRPIIGEEGVRHIAELARLHIAPEEIASLVSHFERMLAFVDRLHEVDVTDVEPDLHDDRALESLRADEPPRPGSPGGPVERDEILANAPEHEGPYFRTPRVL